ncbi:hypothetical protein P154DRAFT_421999 [Amniculicola lignicola CBS 123094]|uniref:Heterokaryon incompatibility domain-containing protein n=1 Tax=Amniculicola lignicola CBS 123094 TaxID=1392246 RepID=A0A6A5X0N1_9PLEO|nr:hypothetical protein P154DRAFT_421999 [Amniculicola lignicola CBS 123094]
MHLRQLHILYEALLYVWGESDLRYYDEDSKQWVSETPSVRCNGQDKAVTPNLDNVLRHIRSPSVPKPLWANALRISQEDHQE